jgi:hypothetical protein
MTKRRSRHVDGTGRFLDRQFTTGTHHACYIIGPPDMIQEQTNSDCAVTADSERFELARSGGLLSTIVSGSLPLCTPSQVGVGVASSTRSSKKAR